MAGLDRFGQFVNRRELGALQDRLEPGERVLDVAETRGGRAGVLAVTDRRVVHLVKGWLRTRMHAWPNRTVMAMQVATTVDEAVLTLRTHAGPMELRLRKADAQRIQEAWRTRPQGPGDLLEFALPPAEQKRRARLARLDRQLARGTITKAEYERAKRAIAEAPAE